MSPTPVNPDRQSRVVWYAVLGVVVLAGLVAVIAARGTSEGTTEEVRARQTSAATVDEGPAALPVFEGGGADPAVGQVIPTVSGDTLDGDAMTIGADGKAKVIMFVAHWCPHCQREVPAITEHLRDQPLPDDVELLTVSTSVDEARGNYPPSAWLENAGWTAPVLADSEDSAVAQAYGLSAFPYFVVTDADGRVVTRATGELDDGAFDALVTAAGSGSLG